MFTTHFRRRALAALVGLTFVVGTAWADDDTTAAYEKLVKEKAPTLVTVKFILKVRMGGMFGAMGDQESEQEVSGVMIAAGGTALVSNTQLGGFTGLMRDFMGGMAGDISAVPTDLKVLVGDDTEGLDAELLARDTELDLAWVKIKDPGDRTFDAVDLRKSVKPGLGQQLLMVTRMGRYFDRVPLVHEARIAGIVTKPRRLYVPTDSAALGAPVYTSDGQLVGITIMQMPDIGDVSENPLAVLGRMSELESSISGLILPAEEVAKATTRAQETAAKSAAEEERKPSELAEPEEPAEPKEPPEDPNQGGR